MSESGEKKDVTEAKASAFTRKPYFRPQLRYLGSVRALTLGSSGGVPDGCESLKNSGPIEGC